MGKINFVVSGIEGEGLMLVDGLDEAVGVGDGLRVWLEYVEVDVDGEGEGDGESVCDGVGEFSVQTHFEKQKKGVGRVGETTGTGGLFE